MKNNPNQAELIEIEKQEYKQRWVSNYFTDREYVKWLIRVGKYDDETLCKAFGADDEALRELRSELAREQIIEARSRLHPGLQQALIYLESRPAMPRQPVIPSIRRRSEEE